MTWESRNATELTKEVMEKIAPEIDTKDRDLLWVTFTVQDFTLGAGYFSPNDVHYRDRGEVAKLMRIDLPVPKGVSADRIRHIVFCFIRDGYDYEGIVHTPLR
jgi:hypothetical protein